MPYVYAKLSWCRMLHIKPWEYDGVWDALEQARFAACLNAEREARDFLRATEQARQQ